MSEIPEALIYTKEHEWIKIEGEEITVGITDYAQNALTDVVWVELPELGAVSYTHLTLPTICSV